MLNPFPTISAKALEGLPQFVMRELGERGLQKTLAATGLPGHFVDRCEGYIPELAAANFFAETARRLGHDYLGLLWAPHATVQGFGQWGAYVLSAPTLISALVRSSKVMPYHSSIDRAWLSVDGDVASFTYFFGLQDHKAYLDIAHTALGTTLSIPRHFLGNNWRPERIEMNIPRPAHGDLVEEVFGCPVKFGAPSLTFYFHSRVLPTLNSSAKTIAKTTIQDIERERACGVPTTLVETVQSIIRVNLSGQEVGIEAVAKQMDTGVRNLQLALSREGTSFRQIASHTISERAIELLAISGETVSSVATELGYSSPNSFSRAFKKETGLPPRAFLSGMNMQAGLS